jgi:hypothetical protein
VCHGGGAFLRKKSNQLAESALADPTEIAVTLTWVSGWRGPAACGTGLVLELVDDDLRALGVRDDLTRDRHLSQGVALAVTDGPSTRRTAGRVTAAPGSPSSFSISMTSPSATLYCLPPVLDDRVHRGRAFLPVV